MRSDVTQADDMPSDSRATGASPYRLFLAVGIGFLVLTVAAGILWRVRQGSRAGQRVGPDDPNSMRLLYVLPNCDEQVYDANGRSLGTRFPGTIQRYWWGPDKLKREFVFECRIDGDNPLFPPFVSLHLNGRQARGDVAWLEVGDANDSWITLRCHARLPGVMRSGGFALGPIRFAPREEPVRAVDVHITYHAGPRGPARATFVGPFRLGQQVRAQEDPNILMQIKRSQASEICLVLSGPPPMEHDAPVLAYAQGGRRHSLDRRGGRTSSSQGFRWEHRCRDLALKSITHVTLGETPTTRIYRGIKVSYPDLPVRTYPAFLDEIANRLDLDVDLSTEQAVRTFVQNRSPLDSASQALSILDVAHGSFLYRVIQTMRRAAPSDLTASEKKQLADILATWLDNGRENSACDLGLWAGWPAYADRALAVLGAGDMGDNALRYLAITLCKYPNPTAEQITAVTDLLRNKNIIDPHARGELVEYVYRHSGEETQHLRRLAECDKPWIWRRIIRPDSRFREFLNKVSPSEIVQLRIVAMGMDGWIDHADTLKPQAYDLLAETITPEFVQKSPSDFDRLFRAFAERTHADRGTEVLIQYMERQLTEWDTWQISNRASSNYYGIRKAVRQLNRWNNLNLGGLGPQDTNRSVSEGRYDWQQIAASTLHWARTGEDQSRMPPRWRMSDRDLRVVWYNREEPERSVIGLWPHGQDPNLPQPHAVMEAGEDFLHYVIVADERAAQGVDSYDFLIRTGVNQHNTTGREFTFTYTDLPRLFDPGPMNGFGVAADGTRHRDLMWRGKWEIRIEPGAAGTSILDGTNLFSTWKERYLMDKPATLPLERVYSPDDPNSHFTGVGVQR